MYPTTATLTCFLTLLLNIHQITAAGVAGNETIPLIRLRESVTGGSEFIDDTITLDVYNVLGDLSDPYTKGPLQFRITGDDYGTGVNAVPHNAPSRQFVISLTSAVNVTSIRKYDNGTTEKGEMRMIKAGDVFFVEDTNGTGHYSVNSYPGNRYSFFYPVADDDLVYSG